MGVNILESFNNTKKAMHGDEFLEKLNAKLKAMGLPEVPMAMDPDPDAEETEYNVVFIKKPPVKQ